MRIDMSNVFSETARRIKTNKVVILFFLASLTMLLIGINHFIEDTLSSLYGIQQLETIFGIIPATYPITYWTMSLAPQVAQIIFVYVYMVNTKANRWALALAISAFAVDFIADAWYRSSGQFLESPGSFLVASALTFVYFTMGSELFITIGMGLTLELLGPAGGQLIEFFEYTANEFGRGKTRLGGGGGNNNRPPQQRPQVPPVHSFGADVRDIPPEFRKK